MGPACTLLLQFQIAFLLVPHNLESHSPVFCTHLTAEVSRISDALAADGDNDVTRFQAGLFRGRSRINGADKDAGVAGHSEETAQLIRH